MNKKSFARAVQKLMPPPTKTAEEITEAVFDIVIEMIEEGERDLCLWAIDFLEMLNTARAVWIIVALLEKHTNFAVKESAMTAIERIISEYEVYAEDEVAEDWAIWLLHLENEGVPIPENCKERVKNRQRKETARKGGKKCLSI